MAADGLIVDRDLYLDEGFQATSCGAKGVVIFTRARIGADLSCDHAVIRNVASPAEAIRPALPKVSSNASADPAASDTLMKGALDLSSVQIGGMADFSGVTIVNQSGPALVAQGLRVGLDLFLTSKVK